MGARLKQAGRRRTPSTIKPSTHCTRRHAQAAGQAATAAPRAAKWTWLTSRRVEADGDIEAFTDFAMKSGWGDGLPLVPPTDARVRGFLAQNDRYPDEVIATLPPTLVDCTVEKIVINAVMAGAPPDSLELLIAAVRAIAEPDFELYGVNATTAPVYPAFVVNGPVRNELDIPYSYGCTGGVATKATAIGRAIRLIMRNIAGQVPGVTSQTTFGSPGRIAGLLTGEWKNASPWPSLAERRGVKGNAVTLVRHHGNDEYSSTLRRRMRRTSWR